jgi:hypothetical protein
MTRATLSLDRTAFGSHYGSGKLFRFLGKHIVNDRIHLHIKIHLERQSESLTRRKKSTACLLDTLLPKLLPSELSVASSL